MGKVSFREDLGRHHNRVVCLSSIPASTSVQSESGLPLAWPYPRLSAGPSQSRVRRSIFCKDPQGGEGRIRRLGNDSNFSARVLGVSVMFPTVIGPMRSVAFIMAGTAAGRVWRALDMGLVRGLRILPRSAPMTIFVARV